MIETLHNFKITVVPTGVGWESKPRIKETKDGPHGKEWIQSTKYQAWQLMPVIPALGMPRQEDCCELKVSLSCRVSHSTHLEVREQL